MNLYVKKTTKTNSQDDYRVKKQLSKRVREDPVGRLAGETAETYTKEN